MSFGNILSGICCPYDLGTLQIISLGGLDEAAKGRQRLKASTGAVEVPIFGSMSLRDAVSLLAATPLFEGVDPVRLEVLAFTGTHLAFDAGETLVEEGSQADGAFLMLSGEAIMLATGSDGQGSAARLDRGGLVGEQALTQPVTWSATIKAAQPVEVLKLEREVFLRLVDEFPEIAAGCLRSANAQVNALASDLRDLDRRLTGARDTRQAMKIAREARKRQTPETPTADPLSK